MERLFSISVKVVVSILFQKARKMLNNERGEANYFSTVVFIFIAVLLLAFIIDLFSIMSVLMSAHCSPWGHWRMAICATNAFWPIVP